MKNKYLQKRKNGFTLVEVLATIAIIGIVITIGGYTIFNTINNSKQESLKVTKNNILTTARFYVEENFNNISWQPEPENSDTNYSCISINELINKNLIKKDIQHNDKIPKYIKILRDKNGNIISEQFDDNNTCKGENNSASIPICNKNLEYDGNPKDLITTNNENINLTNNIQTNAGTYQVKATLKNQESYWKDGTKEEKLITCSIKKAIADIKITNPESSGIDKIEVGKTLNIKVLTNISGTIIVKSSNNDYFEVPKENINIEANKDLEIPIKSLSSKETNGYITITVIPTNEYANNYYSSSTIFTINKNTNKIATIPTAEKYCKPNLVFNKETQTLTKDPDEGIIFYDYTGYKYGTYTITAKLKYGYVWNLETKDTSPKYFNCTINRPSFTVTYDGNEDTNGNKGKTSDGKTSWSEKVQYEESYYTKANKFNLRGYTFNGWNENKDGTGTDWTTLIEKPWTWTYLKNVTLYAQWKPNEYKVTYYGNGGTSEQWGTSWSNTATYDKKYTIEKNWYTYTGRNFIGWTTNSDGTDDGYNWTNWNGTWKYINGQYGINNGELKLYARWELAKYTLVASPNSGKISSTSGWTQIGSDTTWKKQVTYNKTYGTLPTISRTGYTFNGWYNIQNIGWNPVMDNPTSNYKYTAIIWKVYPGVTYNINIDSATLTSGTATHFSTIIYDFTDEKWLAGKDNKFGSNISFDLTCPSTANETHDIRILIYSGQNGKTSGNSTKFTGVKVNTMATTTSTKYTTTNTVNTPRNHVLYARWTTNSYKISYALNNGTAGTKAPTSATYDNIVTIDNPTRSHKITYNANSTGITLSKSNETVTYTFNGWSASNINTSTAKYGNSSSNPSTSWSNGSTKVTSKYFKNLTSTKDGTVTLTANWSGSTTLPTLSKTGYTCKWNTKTDGTGTSYNSGANYSPTKNITLYINCTANKYTVTYNANGGTGTMAASTATYNSDFITIKNAYTRSGYKFKGWNEKADGTGVKWTSSNWGVYENGHAWTWTYTKNITLYAQWEKTERIMYLCRSTQTNKYVAGRTMMHATASFDTDYLTIKSGSPITVLGETGNFYRVKLRNDTVQWDSNPWYGGNPEDTGYIYKGCLRATKPSDSNFCTSECPNA